PASLSFTSIFVGRLRVVTRAAARILTPRDGDHTVGRIRMGGSSMKRVAIVLTVAWAALATAASAAWATDLCIAFTSVPSHLTGKAFTVPRKNTCKPFMGFLSDGALGAIASGTGCTSADGQLLRIHVTAQGADVNFSESVECDFLLPSFTGSNCNLKGIDPAD